MLPNTPLVLNFQVLVCCYFCEVRDAVGAIWTTCWSRKPNLFVNNSSHRLINVCSNFSAGMVLSVVLGTSAAEVLGSWFHLFCWLGHVSFLLPVAGMHRIGVKNPLVLQMLPAICEKRDIFGKFLSLGCHESWCSLVKAFSSRVRYIDCSNRVFTIQQSNGICNSIKKKKGYYYVH